MSCHLVFYTHVFVAMARSLGQRQCSLVFHAAQANLIESSRQLSFAAMFPVSAGLRSISMYLTRLQDNIERLVIDGMGY